MDGAWAWNPFCDYPIERGAALAIHRTIRRILQSKPTCRARLLERMEQLAWRTQCINALEVNEELGMVEGIRQVGRQMGFHPGNQAARRERHSQQIGQLRPPYEIALVMPVLVQRFPPGFQ